MVEHIRSFFFLALALAGSVSSRPLGVSQTATSLPRGRQLAAPYPVPRLQVSGWGTKQVALPLDLSPPAIQGNGDPKGISGHSGPVMTEPISLYIYWLGDISEGRKSVTRSFVKSLNPSTDPANTVDDWWGITRKYYDGQGRPVTGSLEIKGEFQSPRNLSSIPVLVYDKTLGTFNVSDPGLYSLVKGLLDSATWPVDNNAMYVVISDESVMQVDGSNGFCTQYCGWHSVTYYSNPVTCPTLVPVKYIWLGLAGTQLGYSKSGIPKCSKACISSLLTSGKNSVYGGDALIQGAMNILAHELAETASDPTLKSWYSDKNWNENADICSWVFGQYLKEPAPDAPDYVYNLVGEEGFKYLIQANWDLTTGTCSLGSTPKAADLSITDP